MSRLLIFGLGYTGKALKTRLSTRGWRVVGTSREGAEGTLPIEDEDRLRFEIAGATHILSTVPPTPENDPILAQYGAQIADSGAWIGYISSTGVYGDAAGGWVDECTPLRGRRINRITCDTAWLALPHARIFRLPGIYGPGRSPLERVRTGAAHRIDLPDQVFSRVHIDDIVSGIIAGFDGPPGAYNLADDLPISQNAVIDYACALEGIAPPPLLSLDDAALSPAARAFYSENRRVANGKAKRLLGWQPRYPDYRFGLRALKAMTSPAIANPAPHAASSDQR